METNFENCDTKWIKSPIKLTSKVFPHKVQKSTEPNIFHEIQIQQTY